MAFRNILKCQTDACGNKREENMARHEHHTVRPLPIIQRWRYDFMPELQQLPVSW
ncbi:hypothetical protein DPX16_16830 [Anabarilius grahami]|uniref:Uncharacterized protein n=1 Tax=Anabarilius grahami TaxID=495550 RepID=A0A3N0YSR9_ANAGA|nr:hypothetical protein DPX16_16830 [Anabarilius grahami]